MDGKRREVLKTGGGLTLLSLVAAAGWLCRPGPTSPFRCSTRATWPRSWCV